MDIALLWSACEPSSWQTPLSVFLARVKQERGLTLKQLGQIAGVSPTVIHEWLNGALPRGGYEAIYRVCRYANVSLSEALLGRPEQKAGERVPY